MLVTSRAVGRIEFFDVKSRLMEWINYHHLHYFWVVAREGSIAQACQKLHLAQPTISGQIRALEDHLGEKLFERVGRRLRMTEMGRTVFRYADEIFSLGQELIDVLKGAPAHGGIRLNVGIADALPKFVAYRILEPAIRIKERVQLHCEEDDAESLLSKLAVRDLDVVLTDIVGTGNSKVRAHSHLLGECEVSICGVEALAEKYRKGFPKSLNGAPWLLPTANTALRRAMDRWFQAEGIVPDVRAEFEDSALIKVFTLSGLGLMACPSISERDVKKFLDLRIVGRVPMVKERFYAVTLERRLKNPAVAAICASARDRLFV